MQWHMAPEEFMPTINYLPGAKSAVTDTLPCLLIDKSLVVEGDLLVEECLDLLQGLYNFVAPVECGAEHCSSIAPSHCLFNKIKHFSS